MRNYRAQDRDAVVNLLAQLIATEGKPVKPRLLKLFLMKIRKSGGIILVSELDGKIVGTAGGYVVRPTSNVDGEHFGFIEFLIVDPSHRRLGIGEALLKELIMRLAFKGVNEICLEVDPKNEAAVKLYSKLGFATSYAVMQLTVNPSDVESKPYRPTLVASPKLQSRSFKD
ncbi:GNAT family N-acetyltransferase [Candidatus Bathyarchaeota archaeon]|nr:GNAT family N-acetyltransferase [Candidatus Bathyarchaeota archaeon]MBS7612850.1 GNAT family N-acetyltransferase [Candidatus Bathyarchaeota archaeon]MBS7617690.1 GNAT family N-acetyltransferase [Candidatus Bathyarchaeota archaeon]